MEDRIKEFLETAISKEIPVLADSLPGANTCITFHFFNEGGAVFGGGKATLEKASCQVDIWYQVKNDKIKRVISNLKNALKSERTFSYPVKDYIYEPDKRMHHTYFTFELIKKESEV
jgi:hypothetical protein